MEFRLPLGYLLKSEDDNYFCIGFQYGGHGGGECLIYLPKNSMNKFCGNKEWRAKTTGRYRKIICIGNPESNVQIPEREAMKDGIVPDDWS